MNRRIARSPDGKANRTWVMDRGIPTEETLALMRQSLLGWGAAVNESELRLGGIGNSL